LRNQKAASDAYLAWAHKVKTETEPCFKFPKDPKQGKIDSDSYIKQKVNNGIRDLREKTKDYNSWIEGLRERQSERLHQQVEEKLKADEAFNQANEARDQERIRRDAEIQARVVQQSEEYWNWLRNMKEEVAKRPHSAPAARASGVESASSMAAKKKRENEQVVRQRSIEYAQWLQTVSQPKFTLPYHVVVSREEKEKRIAAVRDKTEGHKKMSNDYFEGVRKVEQKHHARIMRNLKKKLLADKMYDEEHVEAAIELEAKMEAERQKKREVELECRRELQQMYSKVKSKPLYLEVAYGIKAPESKT
jgi:hypothetical protein